MRYDGYVWHSQVAKDLGPGHTVVTCLCDSGQVRMQKYYHSCRCVSEVCLCKMFLGNKVSKQCRAALCVTITGCACY